MQIKSYVTSQIQLVRNQNYIHILKNIFSVNKGDVYCITALKQLFGDNCTHCLMIRKWYLNIFFLT